MISNCRQCFNRRSRSQRNCTNNRRAVLHPIKTFSSKTYPCLCGCFYSFSHNFSLYPSSINVQLSHLGGARSDHPRGVQLFAFSGNKGISRTLCKSSSKYLALSPPCFILSSSSAKPLMM